MLNTKQNQTSSTLSQKSNIGHTHDDRYYTKAEVNGRLLPYTTLVKSIKATTPAAERNVALDVNKSAQVIVDCTTLNFVFSSVITLNAIVIINHGTDPNENGVILVTVRNDRLVLTTLKNYKSNISVATSNTTIGITVKDAIAVISCIM